MWKILLTALALGAATPAFADEASLKQSLASFQHEAARLKSLRDQIADLSPVVVALDEGSNATIYSDRMLRIYSGLREIPAAAKHLPPFPTTLDAYRVLQAKMADASQELSQSQVAIYDLLKADD